MTDFRGVALLILTNQNKSSGEVYLYETAQKNGYPSYCDIGRNSVMYAGFQYVIRDESH